MSRVSMRSTQLARRPAYPAAMAMLERRRAMRMARRTAVIPRPLIYSTPSTVTTMATRGWTNSSGELKFVDVPAATYACDTTGSVTALNLVAQGDDFNQRQGRQITNRSIRVHGYFVQQDPTTTATYCRVMLVWDSQPNSGAIASITDILTASTSISALNLDNRSRFSVLRDTKIALGSSNNTATQALAQSPTISQIDFYVNLKGVRTTYSGTSATIGNVATGALLMVTIGNTGTGDAYNFSAHSRLRFSDN